MQVCTELTRGENSFMTNMAMNDQVRASDSDSYTTTVKWRWRKSFHLTSGWESNIDRCTALWSSDGMSGRNAHRCTATHSLRGTWVFYTWQRPLDSSQVILIEQPWKLGNRKRWQCENMQKYTTLSWKIKKGYPQRIRFVSLSCLLPLLCKLKPRETPVAVSSLLNTRCTSPTSSSQFH